MSVTIKDVAKAANVSPSTVSRVISDSPKISEQTKKRVRKVMQELGYHPNYIARSLASNKPNVIGIVFPRSGNLAFQNPFFSEVLRGITSEANVVKYGIELAAGSNKEEIYDNVVQMVQGRRVDGIIMLYSQKDDKIIKYLQKMNFPFVMIGQPYDQKERITHIDNDNISAAMEGTNYLIQLGHENIGFIGGNKNLTVTINRLEGYKRALKKANLLINERHIIYEEFLISGGKHGVEKLLNTKTPPTALLVTDDLMSLGVLRTLKEMDKQVPEDLSIVSFNNSMFAELSNPPLTSVDISIPELGEQAIKQLIAHINNPREPVKRVIIPHKIIKRKSCLRK